MTTEIQAAEAVVEAKVEAKHAANEADNATVAAIEAEQAASVAEAAAANALAEAAVVKEVAQRDVANASLDAEARIAAFKEEIAKCREGMAQLENQLSLMRTSHDSIQEQLTGLGWLKEVTMTAEEIKAEEQPDSSMSSKTDGNTSGEGAGGISNQEKSSGEPEKEKEKEPDAAAREKSESKAEEKAADHGRKKHRWL